MTKENFAPYAPTKAVMKVIERYRERGLPDTLSVKALEQLGVPGTMAPRTLAALKFLGLIKKDGTREEAFERLKRATTEEYPTQLAEVVRNAYLPIFTIVNPAEDTDTALADAFRRYEPSAQRDKMISLFRGLCEEAKIIPSKGHHRSGGPRQKADEGTKAKSTSTRKPPQKETLTPPPPPPPPSDSPDYRLITAVIQQLPRSGKWSAARREKWLYAITSAVDLLIEQETEGGKP